MINAFSVKKGFTHISKACEGFTLIEMLVVVSLVGVLATLVLANMAGARARARDTQRKSDLRQIESALRLYYNDLGKFPENNASGQIVGCGVVPSACEWGVDEFVASNQTYMKVIPNDPLPDGTYYYTRSDLDSFVLSACLENKSDDKGAADPGASWCPTQYTYSLSP